MLQHIQALGGWLSSVLIATSMLPVGKVVAQTQLPPEQVPLPQGDILTLCQPPQPNEILLLVVTRTQESRNQITQLLPPSTTVMTCRYLNDTVTRVGGFRTVDRANAWARYLTESTGLAAYVARPAEAPPPAESEPQAKPSPAPTATQPVIPTQSGSASGSAASQSAYDPKPLGAGYAVLVDYFDKPEVAAQVRRALGKDVGLAAYGQQPFVLATYTTDPNAASAVLQSLSDRGFWASLVDSRRVILLRQAIADVKP